jgi:hypothetical protein
MDPSQAFFFLFIGKVRNRRQSFSLALFSYFSRIKLGCHPYFGYPLHLNYFTAKSLKLICKNAGFTVVKQATTMFQYEAAYVSNCFPKNLIKLNSWQINDILNDVLPLPGLPITHRNP